jgi:hypothetical protein
LPEDIYRSVKSNLFTLSLSPMGRERKIGTLQVSGRALKIALHVAVAFGYNEPMLIYTQAVPVL